MFQRKNNSLPTTTLGGPSGDTGGFGLPLGGKSGPDGSGKAIKMDAPVVKAWKQSSTFTKYSYYILLFFIMLIFVGYRYLRYWNASIWLTCQSHECVLQLTPPGGRTNTVIFSRHQLHSAQATKTDKAGKFLYVDTSKYEPPSRGKGKKKKYSTGSYKGPDEKGEYRSYSIKFRVKSPDDVEKTEDDVEDGDFGPIAKFLEFDRREQLYIIHMRQFGLSHSRTRIRSMINKIESYQKRRRQKLIIKESATLPWQGILCLIFGLLGLMLTLLIGQFWEEAPRRHGGPGTRRTPVKRTSKQQRPSFMVDTGRPSKYPPGYQYQKKY